MSEIEDASTTVARLLKHNLRVIKDNGALANINVSGEWREAEALKGFDGQVTVGLVECIDQKLELSGKTRKRTSTLRVNVWATDAPNAENARLMRGKIVEEVNRSIKQNRNTPNQTIYNFVGAGFGGQSCKVFHGGSEDSPSSSSWVELSSIEYQHLWYSDGTRYQISVNEDGSYAVLMLGFRLESRKNAVKKIVLAFEGYGAAPSGDGVIVKVWSNRESVWKNPLSGGGNGTDEIITLTLLSDLTDYVDDEGFVWLLARTTNPSDGSSPAAMFCDYVSCTTTVNGITYCDVASYRPLDRVDVKPFIYRTEFVVKSWFFENIGV